MEKFTTEKEKAITMFRENPRKALMFCKKWKDLGSDKNAIVRGAECLWNPGMYSQLGYNTDDCIEYGIKALGLHLGID